MAEERSETGPHATPAQVSPEEQGKDVGRSGEAIEPEATHSNPDAAVKTGDRMWGEPGVPPSKD